MIIISDLVLPHRWNQLIKLDLGINYGIDFYFEGHTIVFKTGCKGYDQIKSFLNDMHVVFEEK